MKRGNYLPLDWIQDLATIWKVSRNVHRDRYDLYGNVILDMFHNRLAMQLNLVSGI